MPDYRALAQALDPYAMDTGGITPDTIKALQSGYKSPNLLGMIGDIGRGGLSNLESLVRGGVAQVPGTVGDLETLGRMGINTSFGAGGVKVSPKAILPTTTDILGMMPQRVTQARPETAGMEELGTIVGPGLAKAAMPAVRAGQKGLNLLGMEVADRVATGQSVLPSLLKEPQSAMFAVNPTELPTSITNKSEVKNVADDFANQFKQMGFDVTLDHSGSKVGASSYLRVSDPTTGRFLNKPIRISDHSKGAKELDANINVLNPQEDFAKITSILTDMRKMGATLVVKQDKYAQELIANGVKPKTAYQKAKTEIAE